MRAQTFRTALAGAVAAGAALTGLSAFASSPETIHWQVEADRGYSSDVVQLTLGDEGPSMISSPTSLNVLSGLTPEQLRSTTPKHVAFRVQRDAGEFQCEGMAQDRHASGDCRFQGSQSFAQLLQSRGAGHATTAELYRMTAHNVGTDYLAELRNLHYVTPSAEDLASAGEHGVNLRYIRDMTVAGFTGNFDGLISAHDHGVDAHFVAGIYGAGYRSASAEDLVALHDHGVAPDFVSGLEHSGYRHLSAQQMIALHDHGVTPEFVVGLEHAGYRQLSDDQINALHDHGVSPLWLTGVQKAGYGGLPIDQLIYLRDRGVPAEFLSDMRQAGYRTLTPEEILVLRDHGVSAEFVQQVVALGYGAMPPADIARMRDHGLSASALRKAATLGRKLDADQLIRLRDTGVI